MPFKVKEHYRKTKKGELRVVRESTRKDRVKKALTIGGGALVTLGLGALAYKKLGSKVISTNVETKLLKGTANKIDDVITNTAKYKTLPDPWLDSSTTANKVKQALTTGKEDIKLLKSGYQAPTKPSVISVRRNKSLGGEIRSQRTLIKREPTDIKEANKKLELAKRYEASDSPALQRTGASYRKRAEEKLTVIAERSPSKKQTGLITTRGNASKGTNRSSNYQKKVREPKKKQELTVTKSELKPEPPISEVTRIPNKSNTKTKKKTRRELLTGGKSSQELAENFIDSTIKGGINKAGDNVADVIIPGSSQVGRTIRDIKGRVKQVEKLSNELAENGNKKSSRRGFLKKTINKLAEEGSLKPADAEKVAKGTATKTKVTIRKTLGTGSSDPGLKYTSDSRFPVQGGVKVSKKVYRNPQGLLDKISQGLRKAARHKSGRYNTTYD